MPVIRDSSNKKNWRSGLVLNCFGSFCSKLLRATVCHKLKSQFVLDTLHGRKFVAMQKDSNQPNRSYFDTTKKPCCLSLVWFINPPLQLPKFLVLHRHTYHPSHCWSKPLRRNLENHSLSWTKRFSLLTKINYIILKVCKKCSTTNMLNTAKAKW